MAVHRGAFCQFSFRWIYYYSSNKYTGKETGKTHLCAVGSNSLETTYILFELPWVLDRLSRIYSQESKLSQTELKGMYFNMYAGVLECQ